MRLSIPAIAVAGALLWGAAIFLVGIVNLAAPGYGLSFLQMTSSVYPGFHDSHTFVSVLIGTLDGVLDGAVAGMLFAWLYNAFSSRLTRSHT
jgi:hypothetical protein